MALDLVQLRRVQLVIDALAGAEESAIAASSACHDAAVAFVIGFSMGLTSQEIAKKAREVLDKETARQAS